MIDKNIILKKDKPFVDKLGSQVWAWHGSPTVKTALSYAMSTLHIAKQLGLTYIRYPFMIGAGVITDYEVYTKDWQTGLDYILGEGLVPIVDFGGSGGAPTSVRDDSIISNYKKAITTTITNNKSKGVIWESWNEINNPDSWSQTPTDPKVLDQIVDMLKFIKDTVQTIDPDSLFMGISIDGLSSLNFYKGSYHKGEGDLKTFFDGIKSRGGFDDLDIISIHPYPNKDIEGGNPEYLIDELDGWGDYIGEATMVPTEFGYSTPINDTDFTWQGNISFHDALAKTIREALILDMLGMPIISFYTIEVNGYGLGNHLSNFTPVGEGINDFINRMQGYTFKEKLAVTSYTANSPIDDLYALRYTLEGHQDIVVYWSAFPNRYGVVATSPNVTHKLYFQDMPQIIAI